MEKTSLALVTGCLDFFIYIILWRILLGFLYNLEVYLLAIFELFSGEIKIMWEMYIFVVIFNDYTLADKQADEG